MLAIEGKVVIAAYRYAMQFNVEKDSDPRDIAIASTSSCPLPEVCNIQLVGDCPLYYTNIRHVYSHPSRICAD
jgi:hypothetical protein